MAIGVDGGFVSGGVALAVTQRRSESWGDATEGQSATSGVATCSLSGDRVLSE